MENSPRVLYQNWNDTLHEHAATSPISFQLKNRSDGISSVLKFHVTQIQQILNIWS